MKTVPISVIIPCLNEEEYLGRLLENLAQQTFRDFEVVVVDSKSEDNTAGVARSYQDRLNLCLLEAGRGVANARNAGADEASGEWLLFLDADVVIPPEFLEKALAEAARRGYGVATVNYRPNSKKLTDRAAGVISLWYCKSFSWTKHPIAGGFCILTKREFHATIGGFNPKIMPGEDLDYVARIVALGKRFGYLTSTYLLFDLRRFHKEGYLGLAKKNLYYEFYRRTHGYDVEKEIVQYEFSGYKDDKKK